MHTDITSQIDATSLCEMFAKGQSNPNEALDVCLTPIKCPDVHLNAYACLSPQARDEAEASTQRWRSGAPLSPFDGVPMIIKDNLCVVGMPASWGNAVLAQR